jgi:predicted metal-dependent phosphoesterase TrpH
MLRRFDLHTHSFFSKDACHSPEELISAARRRGLDGIAITDHDSCEAHEYLKGCELPPDFLVVPGVEVSTAEGHMLCIGATLPRMKGRPAVEVLQAIKDAGGLAIPAHPFDKWRAGIRPKVLDSLDIEVLEVFNAAVTSRRYNDQALEYARKRGLKTTAASDAHHTSAVGISTTLFEMEELTVPALLRALRQGGQRECHYLTFREGVKKHFANWFRILNRRPRTNCKFEMGNAK